MNKKKKITLAVAVLLVFCLAIGGTLAWLIDTTPTVKNTFTIGKVKIKLDEAKTDDEGNGTPVTPAERTETGNAYHLVPGEKTYTKDPTVTVLKGSEPCYVRMFVKVTLKYTTDELKAALLSIPPVTLAEDLQYLVDNDWLTYDSTTTQYSINPTKLLGCIEGWEEARWTRKAQWFGDNEPVASTNPYGENKKEVIVEYDYCVGNDIILRADTDTALPALFTGFKFPTDFPTQILDHLAEALSTALQTEVTADDLMPELHIVAQAIQAEGFADMAAAFAEAGEPAGYTHADNPVIHLPPFTIPTTP